MDDLKEKNLLDDHPRDGHKAGSSGQLNRTKQTEEVLVIRTSRSVVPVRHTHFLIK